MKSRRLTPPQQLALDRIRSDIDNKGWAPTRRELQEHLDYSSPKSADDVLKALDNKGFIELAPGVSRGIKLLPKADTPYSKNRNPLVKIQESDIDSDKVYNLITEFESSDAQHRNLSGMVNEARSAQSEAKRHLDEAQSSINRYTKRQTDAPSDLKQALKIAQDQFDHAAKKQERLQSEFRRSSLKVATTRTLIEKIAAQLKLNKIQLPALENF